MTGAPPRRGAGPRDRDAGAALSHRTDPAPHRSPRPIKTLIAALALAAASGSATAQETRAIGAHEHGHGTLDIAVEGGRLAMILAAPGHDIVGFEHPVESAEDQAAIDAAIATLSEPLSLFVVPAAAGCSVTEARAGLVPGHDDAHAEGDAHAGDEGHDHAGGHAEFRAEYLLTCADPDALDRIDFAYFAAFANAMTVDVRMVSDSGLEGFEVERADPVLDLAGQT